MLDALAAAAADPGLSVAERVVVAFGTLTPLIVGLTAMVIKLVGRDADDSTPKVPQGQAIPPDNLELRRVLSEQIEQLQREVTQLQRELRAVERKLNQARKIIYQNGLEFPGD